MAKALYLDCFSGISGDMFLGALIDLGVPAAEIQTVINTLNLPEQVHLHKEHQVRGSVYGIKVDIHTHSHSSHDHDHPHDQSHNHPHNQEQHTHGHHGRSYTEIRELINKAAIDPWIKKRAVSVFRRIGEVEAKIHGKTLDEIHFHEVGALDSIADIVGACAALHYLGLDHVLASNLVEGTGTLHCDHGDFPIPAPATLALLQGTGASLKQIDLPFELITPTGAALLAEFADSFGPMEDFQIEKIGWGLGSREIPGRPNALRAVLGQTQSPVSRFETDVVTVLETNLDDCTGEALGHLGELLFQAGAYDVAYSPITMKKSRPAWQLQVIGPINLRETLALVIMRNSSAFGMRTYETSRLKLSRKHVSVVTPYGAVRIKLGLLNEEVIKAAPEYEDCKKLADDHKVSLEAVYRAALQKFEQL